MPSLFGLDDKPSAPGGLSSAVSKKRTAQAALKPDKATNATAALPLPSPTPAMLPSSAPSLSASVPSLAPLPPPHVPLAEPPTIKKLSKAEWKTVGKIKLEDFWSDEPFVTTHTITVPTPVDTYYFWLTWNPVHGRPMRDRTAFSVPDLNKVLQDGRLTFQLPGSIGEDCAWLNAMPVRNSCACPC